MHPSIPLGDTSTVWINFLEPDRQRLRSVPAPNHSHQPSEEPSIKPRYLKRDDDAPAGHSASRSPQVHSIKRATVQHMRGTDRQTERDRDDYKPFERLPHTLGVIWWLLVLVIAVYLGVLWVL